MLYGLFVSGSPLQLRNRLQNRVQDTEHSMHIKDSEGEVIGVAQAVNKIINRNTPFNAHDEKVGSLPFVLMFLTFCIL